MKHPVTALTQGAPPLTISLQLQATYGHHGAIWEALSALEYLMTHLKTLKKTVPKSQRHVIECVNNDWQLCRKYYNLTDECYPIYAAATFLNPRLRLAHFRKHWTGDMADYINVMEAQLRDIWETEYKHLATAVPQN